MSRSISVLMAVQLSLEPDEASILVSRAIHRTATGSGCGIYVPDNCSMTCKTTDNGFGQSDLHPMESDSSLPGAVATRTSKAGKAMPIMQFASGMQKPANYSRRLTRTEQACFPWPFPRMGSTLYRAVQMGPSVCGSLSWQCVFDAKGR